MHDGHQHMNARELELALQSFTSALSLCDMHPDILTNHKYRVFGDLGWANRAAGRYEKALEVLKKAIELADSVSGPMPRPRVFIMGEFGTIYRQLGRLDEAKQAFEEQYETAKTLGGMVGAQCRAVCNLAMVNYQKALKIWEEGVSEGDDEKTRKEKATLLVQLALTQLDEGIALTEEIRKEEGGIGSHGSRSTRHDEATGWEALGLGRQSLCYTLLASVNPEEHDSFLEKGADVAEKAVELSAGSSYSMWTSNVRTSIGPIALFFYGRVLMAQGKREEALDKFNPGPDWEEEISSWGNVGGGLTTSAIAMCKEPSVEHRGYLKELIDAGVNLTTTDADGYTALDHAVFSGDDEAKEMVIEGLRKQLQMESDDSDAVVAAITHEAYLRRAYRDVLQDKLRGVLWNQDPEFMLRKLRRVYAETLAADEEKRGLFDALKFIRYTDFKGFGRLPRSSDGVVHTFKLSETSKEKTSTVSDVQEDAQARWDRQKREEREELLQDENAMDYLVFFSYRWISNSSQSKTTAELDASMSHTTTTTPDDENHTQYRRMLDALDQFLTLRPDIDPERLCIWMDFACVDQDNPSKGVSALPILITQCDAVISLVDDSYYDRAWCCVEALMIAQLRISTRYSSVNVHKWFEHVPKSIDNDSGSEINNKGGSDQKNWILRQTDADLYQDLAMKDKKLTYEKLDRPKVMFLERQAKLVRWVAR